MWRCNTPSNLLLRMETGIKSDNKGALCSSDLFTETLWLTTNPNCVGFSFRNGIMRFDKLTKTRTVDSLLGTVSCNFNRLY